MRRHRWIIALLAALALIAAACGGGIEGVGSEGSTTTQADGSAGSTTTAPASTTTTTTAATTTTTTVPPTPEESLIAAVDDSGLRPEGADDEALVQLAGNLCAEASAADREFFGYGLSAFEASISVEVYSGSVFPAEGFGGPSLDAIRFAALAIEQVCPENVDVLAASSDQWTTVLDADATAVGVCYRQLAPIGGASRYSLVVDCAEPHHGEIVGLVQAGEDAVFPAPGGDRSVFDELFAACEPIYPEYLGASDGGGVSLSYGVRLLATDEADWDAGERGASCSIGVSAPILRSSVQGAFDRFSAAFDGFRTDVTSCTAEKFEATFTNDSASPVSAYVRFGSYYPTGAVFYVLLDDVAPGESVTRSEEFAEPRDDVRENCETPLTQVAPLP